MRDLSWSKREKQIAHTAFEQALAREAAALVAEVRAKAEAITDLDDLWQLEQFLRDKRRALEERYDYRYSVLLYVFADLIVFISAVFKQGSPLPNNCLTVAGRLA